MITQTEISETIKTLKKWKVVGKDGITPVMVKQGSEAIEKCIWLIFKKARDENLIADWEVNVIIFLYKKSNEKKYENYRAISLALVTFKLYTKIVESRLRKKVENKLKEDQAVFRKGGQAQDYFSVIRNIIEKQRKLVKNYIWY